MKKLVLVLLVAMLSVPAFAAKPSITLAPGGVGKVDIKYTCDSTDANLPSGFGLTVTVNNGATITAVTNLDSAYTIFPGQIDINDATGVVNSYGSPIANALDEPGTGINTNTVVLEFGALYARPNGTGKPAFTGAGTRLCTVTVSANCTVTVTGNERRCGAGKGIIAQNLAAYPINVDGVTNVVTLPVALSATCDSKFTGTQLTLYNSYVANGKNPSCWCNRFQCYGDVDNATYGGSGWLVYNADLNALIAAWKSKVTDTNANPCADLDHATYGGSGWTVYNADLNLLIANWKKKATDLTNCPSYLQ